MTLRNHRDTRWFIFAHVDKNKNGSLVSYVALRMPSL